MISHIIGFHDGKEHLHIYMTDDGMAEWENLCLLLITVNVRRVISDLVVDSR